MAYEDYKGIKIPVITDEGLEKIIKKFNADDDPICIGVAGKVCGDLRCKDCIFYINKPWVTDEEKRNAKLFYEYLQEKGLADTLYLTDADKDILGLVDSSDLEYTNPETSDMRYYWMCRACNNCCDLVTSEEQPPCCPYGNDSIESFEAVDAHCEAVDQAPPTKELFKAAPSRYKYIAIDADGTAWAYETEPVYDAKSGQWDSKDESGTRFWIQGDYYQGKNELITKDI